ncbi:MFS transporter [Streptomyces diastaticus]|uniref:MFS transporter n=1 Tax=Streptomyces diastaticus subsp. diastaticus TaxID=68040 RepID=A0ABQ1CRF1_STRDI|nr:MULTISPECIES: MFS transporter [Streptomyces]RPK82347.1 Major Facilitator Superfamily protein [Streptomyces sp. ADI98-12]GFH72723.1 MFS transporter [Streptomyces diastaticus subsp. diastaticus]GGU45561.1 MFS transporter [Streptomyces diastaticus subsp. diastaticus]
MAYRGLFTKHVSIWAAVVMASRLPVAMAPLAFLFYGRGTDAGYSGGAAMAAAYAIAEAIGAPLLSTRLRTRPYRREIASGLGLSAVAFALLTFLSAPGTVLAVALAAVAGAAAAAAPGALRTMAEDLAPRKHIHTALSLESTLNMAAWAASPALVSVLALGVGPQTPFLLATLATLAATASLWLLPDKAGTTGEGQRAPLKQALTAWPVYVTSIAAMYLLASIELTLPALLEHRDLPVTYSGPILTGFALASIVGGLVYGARTWPGRVERQSTVLLLVMIAGVAATALASTWPAIAGLLALTGLLQAVVLITRNLTLREELPSDLHPVGYSALYAGSGIGYGLSAAATGLLLTATTPDTVVLIATGTTLVLTAATWLRRKTSEVKKPVAG